MRTIEVKIYQYDELSEKAKVKARDWYKSLIDCNDFDYVIENAKQIGAFLGIDIEHIYYSVSYSQGDGACFIGKYSYAADSLKNLEDYTLVDDKLESIANRLESLQAKYNNELTATIKHTSKYTHSNTLEVTLDNNDNDETEKELRDILKSFADWIYERLIEEDESLNDDENVAENIRANNYEFYENGKRETPNKLIGDNL